MEKNNYKKKLIKKINQKKLTIGIIGLGYVGLPLAILFAKKKLWIIKSNFNKKYNKENI